MICGNCSTVNDAENVFCVNCGNPVAVASNVGNVSSVSMPPIPFQDPQAGAPRHSPPIDSTETAVVNFNQPGSPLPQFAPIAPSSGEQRIQRTNPLVWVVGLLVVLIVVLAAGIFIFGPRIGGNEVLPEHLGMFIQSRNKDRVEEIRKQDFSSVIDAKSTFDKSDDLPSSDSQPNVILYADGKDVPINDVKLIQLDTIKADGNLKQLDFQASPVDGKPEMKRLKVSDALAAGKYAFALLDGFFNDGKHKFWAFQVKDSVKSDNGDSLKAMSVALKPTPTPPPATPAPRMPRQLPPPPPASGGRQAIVATAGNTLVRSSPCLTCNVIGRVYGGQVVNILSYSNNYDTWRGRYGNWAYIQTGSGMQGWVFSPLLR